MKFGISTSAIFHDDIADFFGLEVALLGHEIIDNKSNLSERTEETLSESDEGLFEELFFDDSLRIRDEIFDKVDERAWVRKVVPAATTPMAERRDFMLVLVRFIKSKQSL
jgi:hypothetical protein